MKVGLLKDVLVLMLMIVVIFIICIFLPEKIPVHFNAKGAPDMFANKYYLLFHWMLQRLNLYVSLAQNHPAFP